MRAKKSQGIKRTLPYENIVSDSTVQLMSGIKKTRGTSNSTFGTREERDMCDPFTGEPCTYSEWCESEIARIMEKDD